MKKTNLVCVLLTFLCVPVLAWSQATASGPSGYELKDLERGLVFAAPNSNWSINAGQYSVSLTHSTYYDAYISLKKSWYTVASAQEAYTKRKESLTSYLPGAQYLKENEAVTVGTLQGLSMTYSDPSQKKVYREIVFIHKNVPYELSFSVKEENFDKVKDDFGTILKAIQTI